MEKDNEILREAYWEAGIPEYWLLDARREPVRFDILRSGSKGYREVRKLRSWVRSTVFQMDFRLVEESDRRGRPDFRLEVRE